MSLRVWRLLSKNFVESSEGRDIIGLDFLGYKLMPTQGELTPLQVDFLKWGYEKFLAAKEGQTPGATPGSATAKYREKRKMYNYPSSVV